MSNLKFYYGYELRQIKRNPILVFIFLKKCRTSAKLQNEAIESRIMLMSASTVYQLMLPTK